MFGRASFLLVMLVGGMTAVVWAVLGSRLPPADFTFVNETEVASVDPAIIVGQPEGRIAEALFEGLTRWRAEDNLGEQGVAQDWEISDEGRLYTFHLRQDARWSNGDPVTAHDFHYSLRRLLDPQTAARYSYQAWYIVNAKRYNMGASGIDPGDLVEVELNPGASLPNTVRGRVLHGKLASIEKKSDGDPVFLVDVDGRKRRFQKAANGDALPPSVEPCRQVLLDFSEVGIRVIDDRTLELRLTNPTPYFIDLVGYYPLAPVHRGCVEKYGSPAWTWPKNIVSNGAFHMVQRRIRDRIRLVRSDTYWDRDNVRLNVVDALSLDDRTTAFNQYWTGVADWDTVPPIEVLREFRKSKPPRNDYNPAPQITTYFYLLNTTRVPLNDKRVRQALSMAMDRDEIRLVATGAGEIAAYSLVPPALPNYEQQKCAPHNPQRARELLTEAGYPEGRGFPRIEIHYNTEQTHQAIAELVRKQWQRELGIIVSLRNEEWGSALNTQQQMEYYVSRRSWGGDYLDANTFLNMYITGGENNNTGFSNTEYDRLIDDAGKEPVKDKRIEMLEHAERILMDEMPIIPIYYYVSRNVVRPKVRGFFNNLQDMHPLRTIWIDRSVDPNNPRPNEFMERVP